MVTDKQTKHYLYDALGRMVVEFQGLERSLESLIFCTMTSSYSQMRIIFSEMSFKSKVHIASSLLKDLHRPDDKLYDDSLVLERIDKIVKDCNTSEGKRNQLVHSFWIPEFKSSPDLVLRMKESSKSKKGYNESVESIDIGGLEKDIKSIEAVNADIRDLCQKLAIQYKRHHGMAGMAGLIEHGEITEFVHEKVLTKAK